MDDRGSLFPFQLVEERIIVILQGPGLCPESDWDNYLDFLSSLDLNRTTSVRFTDGELSAPQRARLSEVIGPQLFRRAIVTSSRPRVALVNALGWLSKGAKAFLPAHLGSALAHAHVAPADAPAFWGAVEELWPRLLAEHRPLWLAPCIAEAAAQRRHTSPTLATCE